MDLSIIMPCYNMESTILRALNSIYIQSVDFKFEVIVVNDASTDNTENLLRDYANKHENLKIVNNETNCGNAQSFYTALCIAQGDYFCVLDGDDYYTVPNKLQRQIDFFRQDIREEYAAVTHYYIMDLGNGNVNIPDQTIRESFTYPDFLTQNAGYYHTSTYMYRNLYRGHVPLHFRSDVFRGDSSRTFFTLMYTGKKVKVLNFVGSAYVFTYNGIWSSMSQKKQYHRQLLFLHGWNDIVRSSFEKNKIQAQIDWWTKGQDQATDEQRSYVSVSIEEALRRLERQCGIYAFREKDFILNALYYSEFIDSLCATLGYIYRLYHPETVQTVADVNKVAIVACALKPHGGGIFREIFELIEMNAGQQVYLFVTNPDNVDDEAIQLLSHFHNLQIIIAPIEFEKRLDYLQHQWTRISPARAYYYCSHMDTLATALIQQGPCQNVTLFSYDHGFICGISNPNINYIIAKRSVDVELLKKYFENKVLYIPAWSTKNSHSMAPYSPFFNHSSLITCSGAARFYKLDGCQPAYIDLVLDLLNVTRGVHYHLGPLPEEKRAYISTYLKEHNLPKDAFRQTEWVEDVSSFLLAQHVDVFIEPFPVVSYKLSLEVMAAGIPIVAFNGFTRLSNPDFIYPGAMLWNTSEEFIETLNNIGSKELMEHSAKAKSWFENNYSYEKVYTYLQNNVAMPLPVCSKSEDNVLREIRDYYRMFGEDAFVRLMLPEFKVLQKKRIEIQNKKKYKKEKEIETAQLYASHTWRIGRAVTWLPRKIKGIFIHPLCSTIPIEKTPDAIRSSNSWKVGRIIMFPVRVVKKVRWGLFHITGTRYQLNQLDNLQNQILDIHNINIQLRSALSNVNKEMQEIETQRGKDLNDILKLIQKDTQLTDVIYHGLQQDRQIIKSDIDLTTSRMNQIVNTIIRANKENSLLMSRTIQRNFIEHLDYHLVDQCNLNCKCCSTFSPIAKNHFADPQSFKQDLRKLHDLVGDKVLQIHLLGGEPLLHPEIEEFARIGREIFPYARIDFTTNGILVFKMSDSFWKTMKKYDIALKYTQYPIDMDYKKMEEYVIERGVNVFSAGGQEAIRYFRRIPLNTKGTFNSWNSYLRCPYTDCAQLRDGKLYHCPVPPFYDTLNEHMEKDGITGKFRLSNLDYVDLNQATDGKEIMEFMANAQPFCQYCDMNNITDVEWGQSSRSINEWVDR
ncbi:glycosyltransferase [Harryflintia acetispora]|uniref:4Fe-4S single cluster protein n=1 Tax=Harryflintia acetispora TaxID=1849041 RepID=A0A9X8UIY6_9FIRM|nr:glycosyltransferase [Harryflintia acetispora]TCL42572.1 4Fe-4S single cluster protein [Harryflintia acetispora]